MAMQERDFSRGSVFKHMVLFSVPLLAANLLQYLYQVVDMVVVGQVVGVSGIVAISNASMIAFVVNSIAIGLAGGGTVAIAHRKGAGDRAGQRSVSAALFLLAAVCAAVVAGVGITFAYPIFEALHVPAASFDDTVAYMAIICGGAVFSFGYNAACALMKGLGDARGPLLYIGIASVANVVLSVAFVAGFGWGVTGAAWATVISQALACALSVAHLFRLHSNARPSFRDQALLRCSGAQVLKVGVPSTFQMAVVNVSYLLVTGLLNGYGTDVAAASGIGLKISTFSGLSCWAIGQAVTAMAGQNIGAGKPERAGAVVRAGLVLSISIVLATQVLIQLFAYDLALLFGATGNPTIEATVLYLRITCSVNGAAYAAMYCFDSFALSSGAPNLAFVNSLFDAVIVRFGLGWVLATVCGFGYVGLYVAQALAPVIPFLIGWIYYRKGS